MQNLKKRKPKAINSTDMKINEIINETTTAGGMATVVGGLGPAFTRGASIYGNKKPGKKPGKKKKTKYANSVNESRDASRDIEIDTPDVTYNIHYDDRPGIRKWFLTAYLKSGSQNEYVYTKDDKFTRQIPIKMVGFHEYMPFATSNDAQRALRASSFYEMSNKD